MQKKVALIILDGWGIATDPKVSAIDQASIPYFHSLIKNYANSHLQASGLAVGLPDGQMGNSEVGHMNLGAGRIVYQDLVKLNLAAEDGSMGKLPILQASFEYAKRENKKVHFIGLVSDGGVHSHLNHLKALLTAAHESQLKQVFVHAFTDGRDCDPKSGKGFVSEIADHAAKTTGEVATVIGRYYAMDRDKRWERVKLAYDLMVHGIGASATDAASAIQTSYDEGVTDEFIHPILLNKQGLIEPGDVVLCFNFRTDRGRQITETLTQKDFHEQNMAKLPLYYLTMTIYDETFENVKVLYEKDNLSQTLGEVLEKAGKQQIRIAETEKYPHVTFFFSGGREEPFVGESRLLCPSPKVATYDLKPEMSAYEIADKICPELEKEAVDFVCLNFANTDMVGHTGVFEAAVKAAEAVDHCLERVVETAKTHGYTCIVIADHGNSDVMINPDGSPNTQHSTNLVPYIIVDKDFEVNGGKWTPTPGVLGDMAPTILALMGIDKPEVMTGTSRIALRS